MHRHHGSNARESSDLGILDLDTGCNVLAAKTAKGIRLDRLDPGPIFEANDPRFDELKRIWAKLRKPIITLPARSSSWRWLSSSTSMPRKVVLNAAVTTTAMAVVATAAKPSMPTTSAAPTALAGRRKTMTLNRHRRGEAEREPERQAPAVEQPGSHLPSR